MVITRSDKDTDYQKITSMREKYPDRVVCYIDRDASCYTLPKIDKNKYLIPNEMPLIQVIAIIRRRMKIESNEAMFLFIGKNKKLYPAQTLMRVLYDENKDDDQMLYIYYNAENTFG